MGIGNQDVHLLIKTADGTEIQVNLGEMTNGSAVKPAVETVGDVVDRINDAPGNDGKITAAIAEEGRNLWVLDKQGGEGTFTIHDGPNSRAATDLGIAGTPRGDSEKVIQGMAVLPEMAIKRFRDYTALEALNEGEGVRVRHDAVDFRITARDGTVIDVNLGCVNGISKDTPLAELNNGAGVVIDDDPLTPDITFIGRDEVIYEVDLTGAKTFGDLTLSISDGTGKISPFWNNWGIQFKGKGDFFFLFVLSAAVAALVVLILTPVFKRMLHGVE